ncbi:MAG: nucleoside-triphosphatase [Gelidibacter sp.]
MIYILSGNIRTGKTTTLLEWSRKRVDVDGILCPDNKEGKRYFLEINSQNEFALEVERDSIINQDEIIQIGPFQFLKPAFQKANDYLVETIKKKEFKYLIIDELGKLELENEGLHVSAKKIIKAYESDDKHHLILVARTSLLKEIIQKYQISKYELIEKDNLTMLK